MPQTDQRKLTPERRSEIARIGGLARRGRTPDGAPFVSRDPNYHTKKAFKARKRAARLGIVAPTPSPPTDAQTLYRAEKVGFLERQAARLADADVAYRAMLEREAAWRKGGRPKLTCGKAQRKRDPANALIEALEASQ